MATGNVNVTTPLSLAIEHTRRLLFQPFDLSRWFVIGFGAWLATLGEGGFNFNFNLPGRQQQHGDLRKVFEHAREYVMANLVWIIPVVVIVILLLMAIGVAVMIVASVTLLPALLSMVGARIDNTSWAAVVSLTLAVVGAMAAIFAHSLPLALAGIALAVLVQAARPFVPALRAPLPHRAQNNHQHTVWWKWSRVV